ncbi:hypothetical protein BD413DRAFT_484746 [Trametes elegans]|nr:hypothetical protein BD413DRAFT_484746 [Trametes elegans]
MRLDLDTLGVVCAFLQDVPTLVAVSYTCHGLRSIAARRLLLVRPADLANARSIEVFHRFVFGDSAARLPYVRELHLSISALGEEDRSRTVEQLLAILDNARHLETLSIPYGDCTFVCLLDARVLEAIVQLPSLRTLSISMVEAISEKLVHDLTSPLSTLRVSLQRLPFPNDIGGPALGTVRLDNLLRRHAKTLQDLHVSSLTAMELDSEGAQYPAVRSVQLHANRSTLRLDVLQHMFPNLCDSFDAGFVDFRFVEDTEEQQRVRLANKAHQAARQRWARLDRVVGDAITLYALALTCPVRYLTVPDFCDHSKTRLAQVLLDTRPTHLTLSVILSHGVAVFEDLFPRETYETLTHLVLCITYENWDADDGRTDSWTLSFISWTAFLNTLIDGIKRLRLTHLRLIVHYHIDLTNDTIPMVYSKPFVRGLRDANHADTAAMLMQALPSLENVLLEFSGQYEVAVVRSDVDVNEMLNERDHVTMATRGRWCALSGWKSRRDAQTDSESVPAEEMEQEAASRLMDDSDLRITASDEWALKRNQHWTAEETAPWVPPAEAQ